MPSRIAATSSATASGSSGSSSASSVSSAAVAARGALDLRRRGRGCSPKRRRQCSCTSVAVQNDPWPHTRSARWIAKSLAAPASTALQHSRSRHDAHLGDPDLPVERERWQPHGPCSGQIGQIVGGLCQPLGVSVDQVDVQDSCGAGAHCVPEVSTASLVQGSNQRSHSPV
eukprot:2059581-Alexandrium_andersonii.AAC.1